MDNMGIGKEVMDEFIKNKEEIVNDNITSIGMSENLIAVKRVCRQLENKGFNFEVSDTYLEKLLLEGMREVRRLIDDEDFPVFPLLKGKSTKRFFNKIIRGKKDIEGINKLSESEQKKRETLEARINRLKNKGKYDEASVYEYQLDSFNNPDEFIKLLKSELNRLDKEGITENNAEEYNVKSKELKKLTRIKERRYKNSEAYTFVQLLDYDLREYVGKLFFNKKGSTSQSEERFLRTYYGDIAIDFEHLLLLYYYMKSKNHIYLDKVKGLLYYKAIETFYEEVKQVKDAKPVTSNIKPSFDVGADTFAWKRFPQYTRKYMLHFMQPEGYDCYYIEVPYLAQLGYLMAREIDVLDYSTMVNKFKKAKDIIDNQESGIFFNFLSKERENSLLPYILTENFPMWHMDGAYKDDLVSAFVLRQQKWGNDVDMYNRIIKPYSLDMIGSIIYNKLCNLENLVDKDLAYIYYVSPQRVGIAVKKGLGDYHIDQIFGPTKSMLIPVKKPKLEEIVLGEYL